MVPVEGKTINTCTLCMESITQMAISLLLLCLSNQYSEIFPSYIQRPLIDRADQLLRFTAPSSVPVLFHVKEITDIVLKLSGLHSDDYCDKRPWKWCLLHLLFKGRDFMSPVFGFSLCRCGLLDTKLCGSFLAGNFTREESPLID